MKLHTLGELKFLLKIKEENSFRITFVVFLDYSQFRSYKINLITFFLHFIY